MYAGRHLAEVVQLLSGAEADDGVVGIRRFQADTVLVAAVGLHGEIPVHAGDDHVAVGGAEGAVDHQQIAPLLGHPLRGRPAAGGYFADPRADHRVALDAHKVRGGRTLHQKFIQVKRWLLILLGWRRKPRAAPCGPFGRSFHSRLPSEAELLRCIPTEPETFAVLLTA